MHSGDDTYALIALFSLGTTYVESYTSCEDVHRENVTWCVRIADVNRKIETCISLDDNLEPVYNSTCDAKFLQLEEHVSLPDVSAAHIIIALLHLFFSLQKESCASSLYSFRGLGGCLGLLNIGYIFKDVYLTNNVTTDTCSDVTFQRFTRLRK